MVTAERMEVWEIQEGETARQYHAFAHFRSMPPDGRSIRNAYINHRTDCKGRTDEYSRPKGTPSWEIWSAKNNWVERALAHDVHLDHLAMESEEEVFLAAVERHKNLARLMQAKAAQKLGEIDTSDLSANAMIQLAKVGVEIERLALGEPTAINRIEEDGYEEENPWDADAIRNNPEVREAWNQYCDAHDKAETECKGTP